jgi:hypothetical protein
MLACLIGGRDKVALDGRDQSPNRVLYKCWRQMAATPQSLAGTVQQHRQQTGAARSIAATYHTRSFRNEPLVQMSALQEVLLKPKKYAVYVSYQTTA